MPSYVPAKRATAYVSYVALIDQASGKLFKANPTLASGDVQVSIDGGAFANLATLPTVTPAAGKQVKVSLSAAEMTGDLITVLFSDVAGAEWNDLFLKIETSARQIDDLAFPTVPGRSIDVTTTGEVGIDWANIGAPTTVQALSGTTISTSQVVASVTGSVGSVTGSVGSVTGAVGSVTGAVGSVTGSVGSVAGNVNGNVTGSVGSVAANGITAASLDPTAGAEIADAVWDEATSGHLTAGSTGAALVAAGSAGDPWITAVPGIYAPGSAGFILGTNLNATVSSRATQTSVDAIGTTTVAIKAKTDNLPVDPADNSDILGAIAALPAAPSAVVIADTMLNRDMSAVADTNLRTPLNALRRLRNKNDAAVTPGSIVIYKENDTTIAYVATLTTDVAAAPVTVFDPTT